VTTDELALEDTDESADAWPAFVDLLAASTLVVIVFLAVFVYEKVLADGLINDRKEALLEALQAGPDRSRRYTIEDEGQLVRVVLQEDVTFPTAKYTLDHMRPEGRDAVRRIAEILDLPSVRRNYRQVLVVGHTDRQPTGLTQWTNWELSSARAAAVARLLVLSGLDPCRVSASGAGPYFPRLRNARTPEELKQNRRIEIEILPAREVDVGTIDERCARAGDGTLVAGARP
jgi:flagellar motor protein MotB